MNRRRFSPEVTKLIIILAVSFALIFIGPNWVISPVKNVFWAIAYPFQKTFYILSAKTGNTFEFLGSISSLKEENRKLIKENSLLAYQITELLEEKKENQLLRDQLGLIPKEEFDLEACFVVGQDPQKMGNWLMIDKGANSGIEKEMPVIVSRGILVGKIDEVFQFSSRIKLLSNPEGAVNAQDLETSAKGVVRGEYGLGIILDMITQTEIINKGDAVVTSGLGGEMPKGLLIGKVEEIKTSQDKLFQKAQLIPAAKYSSLEAVFVIKNKK